MSARAGRIALAAHDAGGAAVLLPVGRELERRGRDIVPVAAGPAVNVCAGLSGARQVDDGASVASLVAKFERWEIATLVSASGLYNQIEHTARLAAREMGLPVIAVQDAWFNHRERYERSGVSSRPDLVCVMDERSRIEMVGIGFAAGQVNLTGHPGLEETRRLSLAVTREDVRRRRREFGLGEDCLVLTFFSDPFYVGPAGSFYSGPGAIMRADGRGLYGYTVRDILPPLLDELEAASTDAGVDVDLVVRPHPSECDDVLREILRSFHERRVHVRLEAAGTTVEWLQMSDAVLGMMTIALLQGALAGKPAVSIELGLRESGEEDPCMASALGYSASVLDRPALRGACRALVRREWGVLRPTLAEPLCVEGAAARIADAVLRIEALRR
jgi:hypothetical protein